MSRIAYVNGRYDNLSDAAVNVEDRGYQFADGVYEVCEVRGGKLVDMPRHLARLQRSLGELRIAEPMPLAALSVVMHEVVRRNRVQFGIVYLQVSRGVARRDQLHVAQKHDVEPGEVRAEQFTVGDHRRLDVAHFRGIDGPVGVRRKGQPERIGRILERRARPAAIDEQHTDGVADEAHCAATVVHR